MYKFKKGDEVLITAGRDQGRKGKVDRVLITENRVVVSGVNIYKRHLKRTAKRGAGIYEIARPLPVANVALVCPKCAKITRVGFVNDGKNKNRICKNCKGVIS